MDIVLLIVGKIINLIYILRLSLWKIIKKIIINID